jgi:hypothetical protein
MNINFQKKTIMNRKTNFLIYSIEKGETPYICFYMIKNINNYITLPTIYMKNIKESIQFMESNFNTFDYKYMGTIDYNDENIIVYEINNFTDGIIPTYYKDSWWKVSSFEILYTQTVLQFNIDKYYITFFKKNPQLLYLFDKDVKYEVPIVAYIGIDESDLNQQILLNDLNYKNGYFGKGYYFTTLEEAYFKSLYDDLTTTDQLVKLINKNYINEMSILDNTDITIKNKKYYLNNTFIGDTHPNCGSGKFTLYKFNKDFIYIKSDTKMKKCIESHDYSIKRKNGGIIIRYVLFLKKMSYLKRKLYDSYCSLKKEPFWFPFYMVKSQTQFSILSYHFTENNNIGPDYITKQNKDTSVLIK